MVPNPFFTEDISLIAEFNNPLPMVDGSNLFTELSG